MKKSLMILALALITQLGYSQSDGPREQNRPTIEQRIEKASKELDLTTVQQAEWELIFEKYNASLENKSTRKTSQEAMSKELEATLDENQLVKFNEMKAKRKHHRGKR